MKLRSMFFILLFFVAEALGQPLLVVVLMVKNEASVIIETLQPFVDGGLQDYLIFDTGSTDGTQEITRAFFRQHDLNNAHVIEEPFINFAASRNRALELAETVFPEATFMLMLDAEWYMHNVEGLVQFCQGHEHDPHDTYFVGLQSATEALFHSRLIRCRKNVRFVGRVHEVLNQLTWVTLPRDIYFEWRPAAKGNEKSAQRWQRDRDLLLEDYEENPFNDRTLFYLGQTYDCLGDWVNAYTFYKKRADIRGWDEENFITQLRMGNVAQQLAAKDDPNICPLAIKHYLQAFSMRPHRAEPLIQMAQYYLGRNEMHLAFLFASRAVQIPYPDNDVLFIQKHMYDFVRYDVLGICAWYVGEYEIGEWAVRKAMEIDPEAWHLNFNLKLYMDRKAPCESVIADSVIKE
jgi:glycosyltransferase involved in cell wall biosynthesis